MKAAFSKMLSKVDSSLMVVQTPLDDVAVELPGDEADRDHADPPVRCERVDQVVDAVHDALELLHLVDHDLRLIEYAGLRCATEGAGTDHDLRHQRALVGCLNRLRTSGTQVV